MQVWYSSAKQDDHLAKKSGFEKFVKCAFSIDARHDVQYAEMARGQFGVKAFGGAENAILGGGS